MLPSICISALPNVNNSINNFAMAHSNKLLNRSKEKESQENKERNKCKGDGSICGRMVTKDTEHFSGSRRLEAGGDKELEGYTHEHIW